MKLYCTIYDTGGPVFSRAFTGTQADQRKLHHEIAREGNQVTEAKEIDVPTDKAGLLLFLNTCRITDEGKLEYEKL